MAVPYTALDVVNLPRLQINAGNGCDRIVHLSYKQDTSAFKKNKNLIRFVVSLHGEDALGKQFVTITKDRYPPFIIVDQRLIACALEVVNFQQMFIDIFQLNSPSKND